MKLLILLQLELGQEYVCYAIPTVDGADMDLVNVYNAKILIIYWIYMLNVWLDT